MLSVTNFNWRRLANLISDIGYFVLIVGAGSWIISYRSKRSGVTLVPSQECLRWG